ncbi:alpha/beta-hydrolase [Aspergillus heteromorphus CBS 117.55]|uniref:Alpha/beta-hydrolase n=1 Tax=Aspergillus heteromorphus CBS 117.55 TaxID=1448321 RepID=A0A317X7J3_9EURO|nr:alpha/beta-hydrolase [Aspergillus heteromorphus CBS 117.55]PWY92848.1 alpha/beta-hydrolase [Aspergillus heteromorphus CBS 117.55]
MARSGTKSNPDQTSVGPALWSLGKHAPWNPHPICTQLATILSPLYGELPRTMFYLVYLYYKVLITVIRFLGPKGIKATPDDVYHIQSRDSGRTIKVHAYRNASASASTSKPTPVLINFHGSGWVFSVHGSDDAYCREMSRETDRTVLDVQYRLAPENPFPAALNDAEDVLKWVLGQPEKFDVSRVSLSGFSAGGNLALSTAANLFPQDTLHSVLAMYPVVDMHTDIAQKSAPDPSGKPIPVRMARIFDICYTHGESDPRDPRISPLYASADRFPDRVMIVTAACDNLAPEAEALAEKIEKAPGSEREVVRVRMPSCNHGWDKSAKKGTVQWDAREKMYAMAAAMLSR